jgi:hypothetical protein
VLFSWLYGKSIKSRGNHVDPRRSALLTHRRSKFALMPLAIAMAALDMSGCSHACTNWALNSGLRLRLRRRLATQYRRFTCPRRS